MSSFARDHDQSQTMSGRVIPNRRRESEATQEVNGPSSRPSIDSYAQRPRQPGYHESPAASRTMSMASTIAPTERTTSMTSNATTLAHASSVSSQHTILPKRRAPLVYPALLSKVAEVFRERIPLSDKEKDGLVYKSSFTGHEAVELIAYIMQTTDRNLALLLGRSLDAQKFFHDVTYDHRLRDSSQELYQFRETIVEDDSDVNGVFTLTTECYSPTCTPDKLCYSIACPKRVDQQKRLNMRPQAGLKREESRTSLHEDASDEQRLWINTVSKEVADTVSEMEKKRQEVVMELIYTERDFVKDLEYLRDFWMKPLRSPNPPIIPEQRREKLIRTVFSNCQEVHAVNSGLADALTRRQQSQPVVRNVGDILLDFIPRFGPFITYGKGQLFGKYEFEKEKQSNPTFSRFVDETERRKESRKLELNGYLTKPTTRLARYPLFLESILKYTADGNPDKEDLPKVIIGIREVLSKVNLESGRSENAFTLMQLSMQLSWKPGEFVDLKLTEENRKMLLKGIFKKSPTESVGDIEAFLFDNALLFVRRKTVNKREELRVYKRPIPLGLLVITQMEEMAPKLGLAKRPSSSLIPGSRTNTMTGSLRPEPNKQQGHPLTFRHLGKAGYEITLYASSQIMREKWMKTVEEQKDSLRQRSNIFTKTILNEGFFNQGMKINCCVPFGKSNNIMRPSQLTTDADGGRKLVVGTEIGVFVTDTRPKDSSIKPKRVLDVKSVTQVDVLEQYSILLVLYDKTLYSYSMDALEGEDSALSPKRGRKITSTTFFKVGVIDGQHLVCSVKTTSLSATIKVYKPMDSMTSTKSKRGLARMIAGGQEVLRPHKVSDAYIRDPTWCADKDQEFYIPTETYSIHFLRRTLCVGCARGFEIVTLDTLVTQPLLDQADTSLDFVAMKENLRPIHVERINPNFLLSYSDFSFFVNKHGWRANPDWKIVWEGNPSSFSLFGPYILAFEPSFVEIRHMDSGMLVYILTAKNVRMLHSSNREVSFVLLLEHTDGSGSGRAPADIETTDPVRLRRRDGRGCDSESGLLDQGWWLPEWVAAACAKVLMRYEKNLKRNHLHSLRGLFVPFCVLTFRCWSPPLVSIVRCARASRSI